MKRETDPGIGALSVMELLRAVASSAVSPGAGAAGSIALGLAAACAEKAVTISLKHHPQNAALRNAAEGFAAIARRAVHGADQDAALFREFLREDDGVAGDRLVTEGERLQELSRELRVLLDDIEPQVDPVMSGDVAAARSLAKAFEAIERANLREVRQALGSTGEGPPR
ncbi:MAG: cyclodeaminase/cyclohydrolase family protein [Pseudomonadota bacterium]